MAAMVTSMPKVTKVTMIFCGHYHHIWNESHRLYDISYLNLLDQPFWRYGYKSRIYYIIYYKQNKKNCYIIKIVQFAFFMNFDYYLIRFRNDVPLQPVMFQEYG